MEERFRRYRDSRAEDPGTPLTRSPRSVPSTALVDQQITTWFPSKIVPLSIHYPALSGPSFKARREGNCALSVQAHAFAPSPGRRRQ